MRDARRGLMIVAVAAVVLVASGCEDLEPSAAEQELLEEAIHGYLDRLAAAYSDLDAGALEGHATGGEIAEVHKVLKKLAASGDRVEASLLRVELENVKVFREVNATVGTMEVWDVARYDAFNGREKASNPNAIQRAVIQLRLVDGRWLVTARRVLGQEAGPRWNVTTPTPDPGG